MERTWFATWTTYGTWLPGDERGFVGDVRDLDGTRQCHNVPGTPHSADHSPLRAYAASILKEPPIRLTVAQAEAVATQLRETARFRCWDLFAFAVMANHVHLVVASGEEVTSGKILGDFKAWGTRRLDKQCGKRLNGSWWTDGGSCRPVRGDEELARVIMYVRQQEYPLVVWIAGEENPAIR